MTIEQPKSAAAIRMRRMRERRAAGVTVIPAQEIEPDAVQALCNLGWLAENETGNPDAVAAALMDLARAAAWNGLTRGDHGQ